MENELNKITAVEWLWEQIDEILPFSVDTETGIKLYNAKEQAKQMEKEQIITAIDETLKGVKLDEDKTGFIAMWGEGYYKKTYGGNNGK
jgi:hypothetical protein